MPPKKRGPKMPAAPPQIRHARVELEDPDYQRLQRAARARGLSIAGYIRQAILLQVRRDETEGVSA
jgi:hypothetical protein